MRVYFFSKRLIQTVLIGICCLIAFGVVWTFLHGGEATVMADPVYQGQTTEQKMALAINVDWGEDIIPEMLQSVKSQRCKGYIFCDRTVCGKVS